MERPAVTAARGPKCQPMALFPQGLKSHPRFTPTQSRAWTRTHRAEHRERLRAQTSPALLLVPGLQLFGRVPQEDVVFLLRIIKLMALTGKHTTILLGESRSQHFVGTLHARPSATCMKPSLWRRNGEKSRLFNRNLRPRRSWDLVGFAFHVHLEEPPCTCVSCRCRDAKLPPL